jgi:hypothetical protein
MPTEIDLFRSATEEAFITAAHNTTGGITHHHRVTDAPQHMGAEEDILKSNVRTKCSNFNNNFGGT